MTSNAPIFRVASTGSFTGSTAPLAHRRSALHPRYRARVATPGFASHRSCPLSAPTIMCSKSAPAGIATSDMAAFFQRQRIETRGSFFRNRLPVWRECGGKLSQIHMRAARQYRQCPCHQPLTTVSERALRPRFECAIRVTERAVDRFREIAQRPARLPGNPRRRFSALPQHLSFRMFRLHACKRGKAFQPLFRRFIRLDRGGKHRQNREAAARSMPFQHAAA